MALNLFFDFCLAYFILADTYMPSRIISLFILSLCYVACLAQPAIEKKNRLTDRVTEYFEVLPNDQPVKNGPYKAMYKRKTPIAMGNYANGKKVGMWRFYEPKGKLMQIYDFGKDSLKYEAHEYVETSDFWYIIDKEISDTDKVTKPMKAGGRYYGYLPYLGMYKIPFSPYEYETADCLATLELLISPLGRLAQYKVHSVCYISEFEQTV